MGRAITIRGFQLIANHALNRQRQTLFGDGRSANSAWYLTLPDFPLLANIFIPQGVILLDEVLHHLDTLGTIYNFQLDAA